MFYLANSTFGVGQIVEVKSYCK